ncbi:PAS domain S-box protein [Devosia alba]|uniref:PAS domain S-box protein n=1 Tax=Devosia alba TaxID=3152360 RepID=UPI0032665161
MLDSNPLDIRLAAASLRALPVAVYTTDADGLIVSYNEAAATLWGVRPELGTVRWCGSWRLYHTDGRPMAHGDSPMAIAINEQRAIHGAEAVAERPDGTRVPFMAFPTPLHDTDGTMLGAVSTLVDLSSQQLVKRAQQHLAALVKSSHDAIISKDLAGIITTWNESAQRLFGYDAEEAVGKSITMLIPKERLHEEVEILARIRAGEVVDHFETVRLHKDGSRLPLSLTISPIREEDGTIIGVSKMARDITAQKESEERINALMREVNHRVKNQFAVINAMVRETSTRATDSVEFARQVSERIMALSRSHDLLVNGEWKGSSLFELLLAHVRAFGHEERVGMSGPAISLQPFAVQYLGMAFHELATNAVKYGALSSEAGSVEISWSVSGDDQFQLTWTELGALKPVATPANKGFGSIVLERVAPSAVSGKGELTYLPDGIRWSLIAPLHAIQAKTGSFDAAHHKS